MEIFESSETDLNSLCRACLRHLLKGITFDIFEMPNLGKLLNICTSLVVKEDDGFSRHLCKNCYEKIQDFYKFRKMCLDSFEKFQKIKFSVQSNLKYLEVINSENVSSIKIAKNSVKDDDQQSKLLTTEHKNPSNELIEGNNSDSEEIQTHNFELDISDAENNDEKASTASQKNLTEHKSNETEKILQSQKTKQLSKNTDDKLITEIFTCNVCKKRFFKNEKYQAHMRTHIGLKPWECPQCKKQYQKRGSLENHIKFEHSVTTDNFELFACTIEGCEKNYRRKQTLRDHIKKVHMGEFEPKKKTSYICEKCGKSLTTLAALNRHRLLHSGELPFRCDQCPKRYITKYKLNEHMRRHNGIKNFSCPVCGLKKVSQHELNAHMNYHTKKKLFKCKFCQYESGNIGNVSRHEKIVHHGMRTFECKYCEKAFGKLETLKHHVMTHTGEKPHECHLCGRKFIQRTAMKTHLKRHVKINKSTLQQHKQEGSNSNGCYVKIKKMKQNKL